MKKGFFWHYFVENENKPVITLESEYPFNKINTKENNDYLFKVTYFENKINIDFLHILTDGNSGVEFLKEVIYRYIEFKHPEKLERISLNGKNVIKNSEKAYKKNYKKTLKVLNLSKKAYMIKGETLPKGKIGINHFYINLKEIKNCTKVKDCSLSMYIITMIAYSIYETNYKTNKGKKPINICVPVNLKKYFKTETVSNFFFVYNNKFKF